MSNDQTRVMQCMEIWGGNQPVSSGVSMTGVDAWIYSKPFGEAAGGGDVHYVSSCATGRITRLLLADVSGHGQHVADTAARLRDLMRRYVNYLDQTRFVGEMNREFLGLSSSGNFATAIVATVFAPTNDLTLCNAGHPPPLWYRASTGQWGFLEHKTSPRNNPSNIPLGVLDLADYEQFGTQLRVGDWVVCYTDSLIESKDSNGELLGKHGLLRLVRAVPLGDEPAFIQSLLQTIAKLNAENLTTDDVSVLLFKLNGAAPFVPWKTRLLAPCRVLMGLLGALRGLPAPWPEINLPNIGGALFQRFNKSWTKRNQGVKPADTSR